MQAGFLQTEKLGNICISTKRWDGKVFIESKEASRFIEHVFDDQSACVSSDTWIRGILTPGKGAIFQLFDSLGTVNQIPYRLNEKEVNEKLLDNMIWRVKP